MDKVKRAKAAKALLSDETFKEALAHVLAGFNQELLNSDTPEARETAWHGYQSCVKARNVMAAWAQSADKS